MDLGVSVQAGVGGLAPWAVTVRFLTLSGGKNHEGQAATPLAQLVADATQEFVAWAEERSRAIDPYLKNNCVLYDDNHQPMGKLGELSPDGGACIYQGLRVPIGPHFWRDRGVTRICNDPKLTDCFLRRADRHAAWEPVHPLLVGGDCFIYHDGQPWMRAGTKTADQQGCETQGHVLPIGQTLKPSAKRPGFYCYDEPDKLRRQTEKLWCLERPERPQTDGQYLGRRWAGGIDRATDSLEHAGDSVHRVIDEGAQGVPLYATTPVKEAAAQGSRVIATLKNATKEDAKHVFWDALEGAKAWWHKPLRQQVGDVAEEAGDTMASPTTWAAGAGPIFGRGSRALSVGADALSDTEKLGKEAKHLGKAAKKAGAAVAAEDEAVHTAPAWTGGHAYHSPPKQLDAFPTAQRVQQKTAVQGGGTLRKRWKDVDGTIYEWDSRHGTVEKYTKQGKHIGEFDPKTGVQLKPRDPTRRVEK
ncbi:MAG TPA: colicin E3/pyocin S6 family cytotoxin [Pseudomonadota bacterium]|nr:colicin E3/pyocin S6 family cytotoxin [Pseudomonadota bacterium]